MPLPRDLRLRPWRPTVVAASLATNLFALAVPVALLQVYDRVIPHAGGATLAALGLGLLAAGLADYAVRLARGHLLARAGARFEAEVYARAARRLFHPGADPFWRPEGTPPAERFRSIERVRERGDGEAGLTLLDIPFVAAFLAVIAYVSPLLAVGVSAITAAAALAAYVQWRRIARLGADRTARDHRRHAFTAETLNGIEAIHGLGAEPLMVRRYERLLDAGAGLTRKLTSSIVFTQGLVGVASLVSPILMSGLGAYLVIDGQITVGGLAAAVLLTGRVVQPTLKMGALLVGQHDIAAADDDVRGLLEAPLVGEGRARLPRIDSVTLEGVALAHGPDAAPALDGVDLALARGECVSIEGEDGASRSALLAVIAGHRRPDRGRVLVNGAPIGGFDPADLARRVALLSAEHRLLEGTLLENLTAFEPGRNLAAAQALAAELRIADPIAAHRDGLAANLSARRADGLPRAVGCGVLLVAGLVGRPDVILFDEANSNLDARTDRALLQVLRRLMPEAITVLVTYRPSFRALASRRYELADRRLRPLPRLVSDRRAS